VKDSRFTVTSPIGGFALFNGSDGASLGGQLGTKERMRTVGWRAVSLGLLRARLSRLPSSRFGASVNYRVYSEKF
jgi:hypothetical protein